MDGTRFDHWTRLLRQNGRSRRHMLRLATGSGLAALGLLGGQEAAHACRKNGKPCGNGPNGNCCSGTCRKGRCRPTPGAFGCQINSGDFCRKAVVTCPQNPAGNCTLLDNGKPICVEFSYCLPCTSNADCKAASGGIPGKCANDCRVCQADSGGRVCLYPQI